MLPEELDDEHAVHVFEHRFVVVDLRQRCSCVFLQPRPDKSSLGYANRETHHESIAQAWMTDVMPHSGDEDCQYILGSKDLPCSACPQSTDRFLRLIRPNPRL